MLFADSMSLLWLTYYGVSLLVLVAVYFALALLPRLPRLILTWAIAGAMWTPARFRLPLVDEGEFYTGWAPSAMVAAVGFLENNASALRAGFMWLLAGVVIGVLVGVALWWWRRPVASEREEKNHHAAPEPQATPRQTPQRTEPVL
jgi:MFS superfamily sulfate permease-like transporter